MEAKDLMIGDWVSTKIGETNKVEFLEDGTIKLYESGTYDSSFIHPILLTEEILGKNQICAERRRDVDKEVQIIYDNGMFFYRKIVEIKYVHELQHLLRLLGLPDSADNFKI